MLRPAGTILAAGEIVNVPFLEARRELRLWGQAWCRFLIKAADDWDSDKVIDFLTRHMLR
jgi:hypothetical protein